MGLSFDKALQDISRIRDEVDKHAHAVHIEKSKHFHDEQKEQSLLQKRQEEQELKRKIFQKFADFDCKKQHARISSARRLGSCHWILEEDPFKRLVSSTTKACLVCVGIPGSGKTFLTSRVIDCIKNSEVGSSPAMCFHYCTHSDKRTLSPKSIFGSLTRQLLENRDIPMPIFETIQSLFLSEAGPDVQEAKDLFMSVLEHLGSCVIVLDGLHELEEADLSTMSLLFKEVLDHQNVKVFLSTLPGLNRLQNLFDDTVVFHLTEEVVAKDMQDYVAESVQSKIDSNELLFDDKRLRALIIETLQRDAKTM